MVLYAYTHLDVYSYSCLDIGHAHDQSHPSVCTSVCKILPQPFSSLPSPQLFTPSHLAEFKTHSLFAQRMFEQVAVWG